MMGDRMGGWTFRQGRTYVHDKSVRDTWCFNRVLLPILAALVLVGVPVGLIAAEQYYESLSLAFAEIDGSVVLSGHLNSTTQLAGHNGDVVWFVSTWSGTVGDPSFGVELPHALALERETEYCQWREMATESCETCRDDNDREFRCNCVTTYYYDKGWRSHRIFSALFDQPFNHDNPQRDPYPSARTIATDAKAMGISIDPSLLQSLRAPMRKVYFGRRTLKRTPWFFSESEPRQEGTETLRAMFDTEAYDRHGFIYTDDDGWFFSPYQRSTAGTLFRRFGQFVEGSLLDFQIGDLFNSCTAGDIRVRYRVADPMHVSVIGRVHGSSREGLSVRLIEGLRSTEQPIGFVHAGDHSYDRMLRVEHSSAYGTCMWWRLGALLWGLVAERSLAALQSKQPNWPPNWMAACGAGVLLVAMVWASVSGVSDWAGASTSLWTVGALVGGAALLHLGSRGPPTCAKKNN